MAFLHFRLSSSFLSQSSAPLVGRAIGQGVGATVAGRVSCSAARGQLEGRMREVVGTEPAALEAAASRRAGWARVEPSSTVRLQLCPTSGASPPGLAINMTLSSTSNAYLKLGI